VAAASRRRRLCRYDCRPLDRGCYCCGAVARSRRLMLRNRKISTIIVSTAASASSTSSSSPATSRTTCTRPVTQNRIRKPSRTENASGSPRRLRPPIGWCWTVTSLICPRYVHVCLPENCNASGRNSCVLLTYIINRVYWRIYNKIVQCNEPKPLYRIKRTNI